MLRRGLKRAAIVPTTEKPNVPLTRRKDAQLLPLGSKPKKDDVEKVLEKAVLGGEEEIVDNLEESTTNRRRPKKAATKFTPDAAWDDEDDQDITINLPAKDPKKKHIRGNEKDMSGKVYTAELRNQFEKVCGAPSWARMRWEKDDSENEDSDPEASELLMSTGNYLTTSDSLPKSFIQIKRCTDANKESPSNCKMKSVEFHPSAQVLLAAGMANQTLSLFQVDGDKNPKIQSIFLEKFPITKAHFSTDGREVIMASKYPCFRCYDMMEGKVISVRHIKGMEEKNLSNFVVSPDGRFLAFLGAYGNIHLVSSKTKEWVSTLKMNGDVNAVAFSSDGNSMLSCGSDGEVYVWDMSTRDCVHRFIDEGCVKGTTLAVSHNGRYIATGSYSGVVNIYDDSCLTSRTPTPLKAVMNLTTPCTDMAFNSTTEILALSSSHAENAVKLVHIGSMSVFPNFPDQKFGIRSPQCIDFSLNSGYFTIGNSRGHALLYRVKHYSNY